MPTVRILPELERKVLFIHRIEYPVVQVNPSASQDLHDVPGLFGEIVQVLDGSLEGFCSGSYAESLFELVQIGDIGDQAGWGVD